MTNIIPVPVSSIDMVQELPFPPEPSMSKLRSRSNWEEGMFNERGIRDDRIAERQIPSYLWDRWKLRLNRRSYNWQQFQSDMSSVSWIIQNWAMDEATWDEVLDKAESAVGVEVSRE